MRSIGVGLVFAVFSVIYAFESKAETVTYIHTDALGSVVAESDETGRVAKRYSYEPYGAQIGTGIEDGVGYAGHVSDSATGLSYMQQRYYDPGLGRFLSVDPVTMYGNGDGRHFNAYAYGFNYPTHSKILMAVVQSAQPCLEAPVAWRWTMGFRST